MFAVYTSTTILNNTPSLYSTGSYLTFLHLFTIPFPACFGLCSAIFRETNCVSSYSHPPPPRLHGYWKVTTLPLTNNFPSEDMSETTH